MQLEDFLQALGRKSMQAVAKNKMSGTNNVRQIDLDDSTYAALAQSAGRIATLLSSPVAKNNPDLAGSLDDFLGAVYALVFAKEGDFTHRPNRQIDISAVEKLAKQLAAGQVRTDVKWMAGFHFNN